MLGRVPRVGSPTSQLVLRHSDFPLRRFTHFSLRSAVPLSEETGSPKFLGNPCHTCPGLRLRWNLPEQASGALPLRLALSVLPSELPDSSASTTSLFRNPITRPACSLSTLRVGRYLPLTQRLASGWRPCLGRAGIEPAELLTWFLSCLAYMTHPQDEALLGAQRAEILGFELHGSSRHTEVDTRRSTSLMFSPQSEMAISEDATHAP